MTHNALSRSMNFVPMWIIQVIVGIILTGSVAWATWNTRVSNDNKERISVVEATLKYQKDDIKEIKETQHEMNRKLDRLMEMLITSRSTPRIYGR